MFYTYAHYTPDGNRLFYIGKGIGARAYASAGRNKHWHNVVKKYGKPKIQILSDWNTEQEALDHERLLISCFRDLGYKLCNVADGGKGSAGVIKSEETRLKISIAKQGTPAWNKGVKGQLAWNKGIPCKEETKERIKIAKIGKPGKPVSEEVKLKISEANTGRKHSEETKQKCGAKNVGKKLTEEHKQKISSHLVGNTYAVGNTNRLEYKIIGTNMQTGEQIEFLGAKAVNDAGFQHANVIKCIYGKRKSHKGYTWSKAPLENK
jgi:NUMOD3 motif